VAINDHAVLEVHETNASQNNLAYYYGRFNESDFDFGAAHPYGTGQYAQRQVTTQLIPNIIYVDLTSGFAADVAIWLNQRFYLGDTLFSESRDYLTPGDSLLSSPHGSFRLTYQEDGDLAIYSIAGGGMIRSVSKTKGKPAWRCIMQGDGNFVIYSRPYVPIFASDTSGNPKSRLVLADDGTLAIFNQSGARLNAPKLG
jgi:hypothetical protein